MTTGDQSCSADTVVVGWHLPANTVVSCGVVPVEAGGGEALSSFFLFRLIKKRPADHKENGGAEAAKVTLPSIIHQAVTTKT